MSDEILKLIKDKEVQYVDLRFTDLRGKMQHVTFDVSMIDKDIFTEGTMFDGSSIAGWKAINESDMVMRPDAASVSTASRVMPGRHDDVVGGVESTPSCTTNTFSPEPSARKPCSLRRIASS